MKIEDIALNIRTLRKNRKLTLDEVAARSGVTKGCLSQVENQHSLPSMGLLYRLAEVLSVTPAELLQCKTPDPVCVFTPAGHGKPPAATPHAGVELAHGKRTRLMNPLMLEIPAQTMLKRDATRLDQFIYGLEGQVHVTLDREELMLTPGDSIYLNGHAAHDVANRTDGTAKVLLVHATQPAIQPTA